MNPQYGSFRWAMQCNDARALGAVLAALRMGAVSSNPAAAIMQPQRQYKSYHVASRFGSGCLRACMQVSLIKYLLVHAYKAGKLNDIQAFFADCGDALMRSPAAEEWSAWFALPYISSPSGHPTFQVHTSFPRVHWL